MSDDRSIEKETPKEQVPPSFIADESKSFIDLWSTMDAFLEESGEPLTDVGGILERPPEQRDIMSLFKNGVMLVSQSHIEDPYVKKLESYARLRGIRILRKFPMSLDHIRLSYGETSENVTDRTEMQRDILDLIEEAVKHEASDIHIVVEESKAILEMRMNGILKQQKEWRSEYAHDFCAACFAMADASDANYNPHEYQAARISRASAELPENLQALRLQFNPLAYGGRYLIMRFLYRGSGNAAAEEQKSRGDIQSLGYHPHHCKLLQRMITTPVGICIVSGPTGSGKSTTLFHVLSTVMEQTRYEKNVITIEDPPERPIFGAKQMPVTNAQTAEERARKFTQAISASMRSDPDVIMIGEIRDKASADLAVEAAMTGHQVWTTVHANDALMIVNRLHDIGVAEYNLYTPGLIFGLVGQRLLRKLCEHCRVPFVQAHKNGEVSEDLFERVSKVVDLNHDPVYMPGPGCEICGEKEGYGGRTVLAEMIYPDERMMELFRKNDRMGAREHWLLSLEGMSMMAHAVSKMKSGEVAPTEIERVAGPIELMEISL